MTRRAKYDLSSTIMTCQKHFGLKPHRLAVLRLAIVNRRLRDTTPMSGDSVKKSNDKPELKNRECTERENIQEQEQVLYRIAPTRGVSCELPADWLKSSAKF